MGPHLDKRWHVQIRTGDFWCRQSPSLDSTVACGNTVHVLSRCFSPGLSRREWERGPEKPWSLLPHPPLLLSFFLLLHTIVQNTCVWWAGRGGWNGVRVILPDWRVLILKMENSDSPPAWWGAKNELDSWHLTTAHRVVARLATACGSQQGV